MSDFKNKERIYSFDYDIGEAIAVFIVDTEKFTKEMAQATLDFFTWDIDYDKDADPIDEVMKKYAMEAIREATCNNYNEHGVISCFERKEGFANINGNSGILLVKVVGYEFDSSNLEMKMLSEYEIK